MNNIDILIAAAGKGSRSGLNYPKTLYKIQETPILVRILNSLERWHNKFTSVISSPHGKQKIYECLIKFDKNVNILTQRNPLGMGDAVLQYASSSLSKNYDDLLLIWGDIPFIQERTVQRMVDQHFKNNNDFTFVTKFEKNPYTIVSRNHKGDVVGVIETREKGVNIDFGERDIGVFLFKKKPVFSLLDKELNGKYSETTGEHGFLYIVEHLVKLNYKVSALSIASELEAVSFNSMSDIDEFL